MHLVLKVRREYPMLTKAKVGHDLTRGPPSTPMSRLQNTHTYIHTTITYWKQTLLRI